MPQISIEYSANAGDVFDARALAFQVHEHLIDIAEAEPAACKSRLTEFKDYAIGDGAEANAMIHIDVKILSGRTVEQKKRLGAAIMSSLEQMVGKPAHLNLQLTVDVRDTDREFYHKSWRRP